MRARKSIIKDFPTPTGHTIRAELVQTNYVHNVMLWKQSKMVGRALLLDIPGEAASILLDIYIYNEEDRQHGMGDELVTWITDKFPYVITSYLSNAGLNLCLKHGFQLKKALFGSESDLLIFKKEGYDAVQVGGAEEVPVREAPGDSQAVGEAHAEGQEATQEGKEGEVANG